MKKISVTIGALGLLAMLTALAFACDSTGSAGERGTVPDTAPTVEIVLPTATPANAPALTASPPSAPTPTPAPTPPPVLGQLTGVPGIVDPGNLGWPREVEGLNGIVEIPAKPQRIITASLGHDEMVIALVPNERLVAVGGATKAETYSNIAAHVQDKAEITRDPETIIAQNPDIVVTSPHFTADLVEALTRVGIPAIQTPLDHDSEARIDNILLLGYIFGEEARALEFAQEVSERHEALIAITGQKDERPRVLALTSYSDDLWTAGAGSTEGSIIEMAGGINAATDQGVESNQVTSLEGVIAMNPDIIIIPQPVDFGAENLRQRLLAEEALAELPAITGDRVYVVESRHFTTLSYWNIRGAEDLARILWPDDFTGPPAEGFSVVG